MQASRTRIRQRLKLEAALTAIGGEVTVLAAAVVADGITESDGAPLSFLGVLFVVCMVLWFENRRGRTSAAYGALFIAAPIAGSIILSWSARGVLWLTGSAGMIGSAVIYADRRHCISFLRSLRFRSQDELLRLAALGKESARLLHDLASPLTAVALAIGELQREPALAASGARDRVDDALAAARRLEAHIAATRNQLRAPDDRRSFPVTEECESVVRALAPLARRYATAFDVGVEPILMEGQAAHFARALSNLVANAIEAHDPTTGGTVSVRGVRGPERYTLSVIDDGRGMPPAVLRRAGQRFFTTKTGGLGIGLMIARDLFEREFDASFRIRSAPGQGTCIMIALPVA